MLKKLKKRFLSNLIINETPSTHQSYEWFLTDKQDLIGIKKDALTDKDYEWLTIFLTPIQPDFTTDSMEQSRWRTFLYPPQSMDEADTLLKNIEGIQFLHFHTPKPFFEKEGFQEALDGLIPSAFLVLWKDYSTGVILLINSQEKTTVVECEQIVHTIQMDFLIDLHFFIGNHYSNQTNLQQQFSFEHKLFHYGLQQKKQSVYTFSDALPQWIMHHFPQEEQTQIQQCLFQDVLDDKDLLQTIQVFIECNLNLSLTAKTLYMHRNSVQYRLDRFIEKTGIDIKQFNGALIFYLTYLKSH